MWKWDELQKACDLAFIPEPLSAFLILTKDLNFQLSSSRFAPLMVPCRRVLSTVVLLTGRVVRGSDLGMWVIISYSKPNHAT